MYAETTARGESAALTSPVNFSCGSDARIGVLPVYSSTSSSHRSTVRACAAAKIVYTRSSSLQAGLVRKRKVVHRDGSALSRSLSAQLANQRLPSRYLEKFHDLV